MKTKEQIIEETGSFYNSNNRSVDQNLDPNSFSGNCRYIAPDGKRCAFSRNCKDDEETNTKLKDCEGQNAETILNKNGQEVLLEEYQGHEPQFWNDLQGLHDREFNWTERGLSMEGEKHKAELLAKYKD